MKHLFEHSLIFFSNSFNVGSLYISNGFWLRGGGGGGEWLDVLTDLMDDVELFEWWPIELTFSIHFLT